MAVGDAGTTVDLLGLAEDQAGAGVTELRPAGPARPPMTCAWKPAAPGRCTSWRRASRRWWMGSCGLGRISTTRARYDTGLRPTLVSIVRIALKLTFKMLSDKDSDYHRFNKIAGMDHTPEIHAVVMTHCGHSRKSRFTPDSTTKFFTNRALNIAKEYEHLFSDKVENCFYLLDDFSQAGESVVHNAFR